MRTDWSRDVDPAYPFQVRPAYRSDPNPLPPYDPACIFAWCVAFPLGAMIVLLAIARLVRLVFDLTHPIH